VPISIGISLCEDNFRIFLKILYKKIRLIIISLLTFLSRKLEYQQELVLLLVQAVNYDFWDLYLFYKSLAKAKKLTWIVRSQDLDSNSLMRGYNICGSLRINWIIRPNLTLVCIIWLYCLVMFFYKFFHITNTAWLSNRSYSKMFG